MKEKEKNIYELTYNTRHIDHHTTLSHYQKPE